MQTTQTAQTIAALPFTSFCYESGEAVFFSNEAEIHVADMTDAAFDDFDALISKIASQGLEVGDETRVMHGGWLYKAGLLFSEDGGRMWNVEKVEPQKSAEQIAEGFSFDAMDWN
jgi:hypothetical protein